MHEYGREHEWGLLCLFMCLYGHLHDFQDHGQKILLLSAPFASLVGGSDPRGYISLVSIPRLHSMPYHTDPEILSKSMGSVRPRLGYFLGTSLLGLR